MPVELIINSSQFLNQYKNGVTFTDSTSDVTYNLAANVMEKVKYTTNLDVRWFHQSTGSNPSIFENLGGNLYRYKKTAGSFLDDGFSVGDSITSVSGSTSISGSITVIMIDWMYIQYSTTITVSSGVTTTSIFHGTSPLTALIYSFGLIDNTETTVITTSNLSGNNQAYYAGDLVVGVPQTMIKQGAFQDWVTGTATIEKLATVGYIQKYTLTHEYIINPYYLEGELPNLQDVIPSPLFAGSNSLKHVLKLDFRTGLSNPNSSKLAEMGTILGSTGYFGENMNGFNDLYSLGTATYEDATGNSADGILTGEETTIRITISKVTGAFVSTDKVGSYVSYLARGTDYTNTLTNFEDNFIYDNSFCLADGVPVAGANVIDQVTATLNGDDIDLVIKTSYSVAQQIYLASNPDPYFLLSIQIGDVTLTNPNSDRLMLIADAERFDVGADIPGLLTVNNFRYFSHDMTVGVDAGYTSLTGWNEDGFTCTFDFDLDLNLAALLNTLDISLVAIRTSDYEFFELDNYSFQLSNVVANGVQQLDMTEDRGYVLASGSQFNDVSLVTGANVAGIQNYTGTFSQKISWQEWIQNLDVDSIFYDINEVNSNRNFKASNYSDLNGYVIAVVIKANLFGENPVLGTSGLTDYLVKCGTIDTYDYDLDWNVTPEWSAVIETFTADGLVNLGGAIQTDGSDTLMKATYTNSGVPIFDVSNFWSVHRVEPQNNFGYGIEELSSVNTSPSNQIPIPLPPATLLDIQAVTGNVETTSLISGSVQNPNTLYKLSSRLQSPNLKAAKKSFTLYSSFITPTALPLSVTNIGVASDWTMGDGNDYTAVNNVSHVYTLAGLKGINIKFDNYADITGVDFNNTDVRTNNAIPLPARYLLNLTPLTSLDNIKVYSNTNLTTLKLPLSNYTYLDANSCNLLELDLSGCDGGVVNFHDNTNLTSVLNPVTSSVFTVYWAYNCTNLSILDLSGLTRLGGSFKVFNNDSLASIINPVSSEVFTEYFAGSGSLTSLDVSGLTNLGGRFIVSDESILTSLALPASPQVFIDFDVSLCDLGYFDMTTLTNLTESNGFTIDLSDNSMTASEVNHFLFDWDTLCTGTFAGTFIIDGTNAAPDSITCCHDGLVAKASLISKGQTVITN